MKENMTFTISSVEELPPVIDHLISILKGGPKVVLLYGELGAGKTTMVKYLVSALGSKDKTSSPTYGLVNEYRVTDGKFYHIDLYRIHDTAEAQDIGIEDYLYSGDYCFVEWPQVITPLIHEYWEVHIEVDDRGHRKFDIIPSFDDN